jgi:hypothetical protein
MNDAEITVKNLDLRGDGRGGWAVRHEASFLDPARLMEDL